VQPVNAAPPNAWRVQQIVSLARQTLDSLREIHGLVIDDEDEALAALAEEGVDVETVLSRLGRAALDARADVEAANARLTALAGRRDRAARREEVLRETLLAALQAVGMKSHKDAEFSASWRHGKPKLLITDETRLPADLITQKITLVPDREAIRAALDAGELIPGASLSNGNSILTLRTK
jgi:hypothetical protein